MKHYFSELRRWIRTSLLGATKTQELPGEEVDQLLAKYPSEEVTKELFDFGQMLLTTDDERVGLIDSKATTLIGYSSAILAFLLMRGASWTHSWVELIAIALVAVLAGLACVAAFMVVRGAQNWSQLSEATWFPRDQVLAGPDQLKRFYISAMHQVLQDNHRIANRKADQMIVAQILVAAAGVLLAIILTVAIATTLIRSFTCRPSELYSASAAPVTARCVAMYSGYRGLRPFARYSMFVEDRLGPDQQGQQEPCSVCPSASALDFPASHRPHFPYFDYRQA